MNTERLVEKGVALKPDTVAVSREETMPAEGFEALTTLSFSAAAGERLAMVSSSQSNTRAEDDDDEEFEIPHQFTKSGRKRAVSFPLKLMKVLSNRNFAHIITWMPSGKSFSIVKPKLFATEILPDHFKSAKYSSFTRKMHRWGFMRHYRGDESGAFYHKDFQKDRLDLVEKMACQKAPEPFKASSLAAMVEAAPKRVSHSSKAIVAASASSLSSDASNNGPISSLQDQQRKQVTPVAQSVQGPMARLPLPVPPPIMAPLGISQHSSAPGRAMGLSSPMVLQQSLRSEMPAPTPESIVAAELNAAIEMEVSRRLQQRITAAAAQISRASAARMGSMLQPPSARIALNENASALRTKLMQMQQQKEQLQYLYMTGSLPLPVQGLGELPKTNIQGAKTA